MHTDSPNRMYDQDKGDRSHRLQGLATALALLGVYRPLCTFSKQPFSEGHWNKWNIFPLNIALCSSLSNALCFPRRGALSGLACASVALTVDGTTALVAESPGLGQRWGVTDRKYRWVLIQRLCSRAFRDVTNVTRRRSHPP